MNAFKKSRHIGPSGMKCPCCHLTPTKKKKGSKSWMNKFIRRINKHELNKEYT
jgi:hypothetical protein